MMTGVQDMHVPVGVKGKADGSKKAWITRESQFKVYGFKTRAI